jgi:LysR family transcriptional regulator, glycine cleavage system transcriptional activator
MTITPSPGGLVDLESLACAEALARTLHFQRAAKSRALSAPAFGRRIQLLEEQLGRPLFQRTTRRVQLADGAEEILVRARKLLEDAAALASGASQAHRAVDIVIGTRHELGMSFLMPARAHIARALPGVRTHVFFGSTHELEGAVASLRAHAAITSRLPASLAFDAEPIHREDYELVASPRAPEVARVRTLEGLAQHTLLDIDDTLPLASYLFRAAGALRFASVTTLGTIEAVRFAARAGEGVAVLPRYFVADDLKRKHLVRVSARAALAHDFFRLVFRRDAPERSTLARIANVLRSLKLR